MPPKKTSTRSFTTHSSIHSSKSSSSQTLALPSPSASSRAPHVVRGKSQSMQPSSPPSSLSRRGSTNSIPAEEMRSMARRSRSTSRASEVPSAQKTASAITSNATPASSRNRGSSMASPDRAPSATTPSTRTPKKSAASPAPSRSHRSATPTHSSTTALSPVSDTTRTRATASATTPARASPLTTHTPVATPLYPRGSILLARLNAVPTSPRDHSRAALAAALRRASLSTSRTPVRAEYSPARMRMRGADDTAQEDYDIHVRVALAEESNSGVEDSASGPSPRQRGMADRDAIIASRSPPSHPRSATASRTRSAVATDRITTSPSLSAASTSLPPLPPTYDFIATPTRKRRRTGPQISVYGSASSHTPSSALARVQVQAAEGGLGRSRSAARSRTSSPSLGTSASLLTRAAEDGTCPYSILRGDRHTHRYMQPHVHVHGLEEAEPLCTTVPVIKEETSLTHEDAGGHTGARSSRRRRSKHQGMHGKDEGVWQTVVGDAEALTSVGTDDIVAIESARGGVGGLWSADEMWGDAPGLGEWSHASVNGHGDGYRLHGELELVMDADTEEQNAAARELARECGRRRSLSQREPEVSRGIEREGSSLYSNFDETQAPSSRSHSRSRSRSHSRSHSRSRGGPVTTGSSHEKATADVGKLAHRTKSKQAKTGAAREREGRGNNSLPTDSKPRRSRKSKVVDDDVATKDADADTALTDILPAAALRRREREETIARKGSVLKHLMRVHGQPFV